MVAGLAAGGDAHRRPDVGLDDSRDGRVGLDRGEGGEGADTDDVRRGGGAVVDRVGLVGGVAGSSKIPATTVSDPAVMSTPSRTTARVAPLTVAVGSMIPMPTSPAALTPLAVALPSSSSARRR